MGFLILSKKKKKKSKNYQNNSKPTTDFEIFGFSKIENDTNT
jgi:hypothetical protein